MVKCPGGIGWKANARSPGWKVWENAPLLPGGMGTAGIDRCVNTKRARVFSSPAPFKISIFTGPMQLY